MSRIVKHRKGCKAYVPVSILDEAESIMKEDGVVSRSEAMRSLVKYARVGREAKRIMTLKWPRR